MSEFAYLRYGDRIGAPIHRIVVERSQNLLLIRGNGETVKLPEGKDTLEFRKEREEAGVEFSYRLVSFQDWLGAQDQSTVRKWQGTDEKTVYPPSPVETFWSEYASAGEPWTLQLLSMETGERVEGHEDLIAKVREDLLNKSKKPQEAPTEAPSEETTETPSEGETTPEEPQESVPEASEEAEA